VQLSKARQLSVTPRLSQPLGVAATFIFVTLGWVWFALPAPQDAGRVFGLLFGMQ
jgi:D-alanyl-lipoteichoic acid acyltransferase DltB (MBOAT superfamily)